METEKQPSVKPVFWGLLGGGFLAMFGGIVMFIYVVPRDLAGKGDVPRDANLLFTNVFMEQLAYHNEKNRYAAALGEVKVDPEICARYSCRLTVPPDGSSFLFRLSKEGITWGVSEKSPVPKEIP